ncbi:MAG: efflux RND transporter periplasmic adaptor subunit [Deltaproteobacteria bacterium]|nr:efflux RND transporter periplasmic adaptor subunit [Deltaproteobacteria bacterium]MBW2445104.1 efflux RND transporter periplasmic adaptor subunit [Deltaproteobacteria bacterium]
MPRPVNSLRLHGFRALAATVLAAFLGAGCGQGEAAPAPSQGPREVSVEVVTLAPELLRDEVSFVGQLDAWSTVMLRAEAEGVIEDVGFEEGQVVEKGDILFRLRNDEQRARLRLAQAELGKVSAEYDRTLRLKQHNAASAAALERQDAERQIAQAAVDLAQVHLQQTYVRAPFSGYTGQRLVWVGDRVDEKRDLVRLDDIERVVLFFSLPEQALPLAKPGVPLTISVAPYPGEYFHGKVFFVSPYLEATTRRLSVKAEIPNPDGKLRPGLFAQVEAVIDERPDSLLVPEASVVYDRVGAFVWRVGQDGTANRAAVSLGLRVKGRVEVLEGLTSGDRVVAAGTNKVSEGSKIRAAPERTAERRGPGADALAAPVAPGGDVEHTAERAGADGSGT